MPQPVALYCLQGSHKGIESYSYLSKRANLHHTSHLLVNAMLLLLVCIMTCGWIAQCCPGLHALCVCCLRKIGLVHGD